VPSAHGIIKQPSKTRLFQQPAKAPPRAQDAARRLGDADASAAYLLGQTAFAHLIAARTFDLRVDDQFLRVLQDKRYKPYLHALLAGPKDGTTLARAAGEAKETVSRKLAVLRGRGAIFSRRDGTTVVNSLSPPAAAFLQHLGVVPADEAAPQMAAMSAEIARARDGLPEHLREVPSFSLPANSAALSRVA
jgi:DNA-binding transcriptional ArsR family regulator